MKKNILLIFCLVVSTTLFSQSITITGSSSVPSTCKQNGTISVTMTYNDAGSTLTGVYYSIVAQQAGDYVVGETLSADPNGYTFTGVPPGNHKVQVTLRLANAEVRTDTKIITVINQYIELEVSAFKYAESLLQCDETGAMYVNAWGGKRPLKITIATYTGSSSIDPVGREHDSVSGIKNFFRNLPSGAYKFKIEDACGSVEYVEASLGTIDLSLWNRWLWDPAQGRETPYMWRNSCDFHMKPFLSTIYSGGGLSADVVAYYNTHPGLTFQVGTGPIYKMGETAILQPTNLKFSDEVKIFTKCGLLTSTTITSEYKITTSNRLSIYHRNSYACDSLSIRFQDNIGTNSTFRVKIDGAESPWYPIEYATSPLSSSKAYWGAFPTGYTKHKDLSNNNVKIEVQLNNGCGGISDYITFAYNPLITFQKSFYDCDNSSMSVIFYIGEYTTVCFPVKYVLTHTVTGEKIEKEANPLGKFDTITGLKDGSYTRSLVDANGDIYPLLGISISRTKAEALNIEEANCDENRGQFRLVGVSNGTRIELLESPPGTNYYYDAIAGSDYSHIVYADNGRPGIAGTYKFKVTHYPCTRLIDTLTVTLKGYKIDRFTIDTISENCAGMTIKPTVTLVGTASPSYFRIEGPSGFPTQSNVASGTEVLLNIVGRYIIGARNCLRYDTIYYDGGGLGLDMNKSVAFVCPESSDNEGRIHVVGIGGNGIYDYYLSNKGDGGQQVIGNPAKYIAHDTIGEFYNNSLSRGTSYDITIVDGCGAVRVQEFTIGLLSEVRIAFVEKSPVCVGEPIQFKSMALPNPTYEWFKPGQSVAFSTLSNPVINPASLSDAGTYKVSITTSLCVQKIEDLEVSVDVRLAPTLTLITANKDQEICSKDGTGIQMITYEWGPSVTDVQFSGTGLTFVNDPTNLKTEITGSPSSTIDYTLTALGACSNAVVTGTIKVSNPPTLTLNFGKANQIVCLGGSVSVKYKWTTITNELEIGGTLPNGVSYSIDNVNKELTISGTPNQAGIFNYTVTAKTTDPSNICTSTVLSGVINVVNELTKPDAVSTIKGLNVLVDVLTNDDHSSAGALSLATVSFKTPEDATKGAVSISNNKLQFTPNATYAFTHGEKVHMLYEVAQSGTVICEKEEAIVVVYLANFNLLNNCSFNPELQTNILDQSYTLQWQKSPNNTSWTSISLANSYTLPLSELENNMYYRIAITRGYFIYTRSIKLKVEKIDINNRPWYNVEIE